MAEGISVGGLASGLDTNGIIDGLVKVEQQRVTREETIKSNYELKLDKFNELKGKLDTFAAAAKDLDTQKALNLFATTSSDDDIVTISGDSEATAGNYDIKVESLATALKVASKSFNSYTTGLGASGTFTLSTTKAAQETDPLTTEVTISVAATDSLKDVVNKINRAKGGGASASIFQAGPGDYRLMLTGVEEGTRAFTMENATGDPLGAGLGLVNDVRALRTEFDLRLRTGGPATTATLLAGNNLFNGIGANNAITAGDTISWTGTDANGNNAAGSLVIGGADTVQTLLNSVRDAYGGVGNVNVTLNSSGEIEIEDLTGGASDMVLSMSFNDTNVSGSVLSMGDGAVKTDFTNVVSEGKKAFYLLNDLAMSSQSNKDSETVIGTTFNMKRAEPGTAVKLTLSLDKDAIAKKVQGFLDQYNAVIKFIDDNSKVEVTQDSDKSGSLLDQLSGKSNDEKGQKISRGPFANDSTFRSLRDQLKNIMTGRIAELADQGLSRYSSLAALGIVSDRKDGSLKVDEDTFKEAIDSDFDGIKRLFLTGAYSSVPEMSYGTSSKDTKTGVYAVNTIANTFDKKRDDGFGRG
jgi:flagellar hook-associated protein 2